MESLRTACERQGFVDVRSYIASGNLVFSSALERDAVEAGLEEIVMRDFGFHSDAIARSLAEWKCYAEAAPFPVDRCERPSQINLCLSKRPPDLLAAEKLVTRATLGERVTVISDAIWIDFAGGVGLSKITPSVLDRSVGSPVTTRNWNTVAKLLDLARDAASD